MVTYLRYAAAILIAGISIPFALIAAGSKWATEKLLNFSEFLKP